MHLTIHSDYALRVLLFLKVEDDRSCTIQEIAEAYGISRNHLMKVAQELAQLGYVNATRGRGGGLRLALPPGEIRLGEVVRRTEPHFNLAECFDLKTNTCPIVPACDLKRVLAEAGQAFLATLDGYTLADLGRKRTRLRELLGLAEAQDPRRRSPTAS